MLGSGASRKQIARTLNVAYEHGLLSEETFTYRFDQLLGERVIDPSRLIGDLTLRRAGAWHARLLAAIGQLFSAEVPVRRDECLLALDWIGATDQLLLGRHHSCDVVLDDPTVSRLHARLAFRHGKWVLNDLASTNGTIINGVRLERCTLRPGDHLVLGEAHLRID
jgi:hypothetical protein